MIWRFGFSNRKMDFEYVCLYYSNTTSTWYGACTGHFGILLPVKLFEWYVFSPGTYTHRTLAEDGWMGDDGGTKLEDVQRALGALVFDGGVRRLLAAADDDLPMSQLRTLAEPMRPPPPSEI